MLSLFESTWLLSCEKFEESELEISYEEELESSIWILRENLGFGV